MSGDRSQSPGRGPGKPGAPAISVAALVLGLAVAMLPAPALSNDGQTSVDGSTPYGTPAASPHSPPSEREPSHELSPADMKSAMHAYFEGEKDGGIGFMTVGALGLAAGGVLVAFDEPSALRPASYPMLGIGALQLAVGIIVYTRTDAQVAELDAQLADDPAAFATAERERMAGVETGFIWLEVIEAILIAGGAAAAVAGFVEDIPFAQGFGLGLAGEAAATLALDIWAAARASDYVDALNGFGVGLSLDPGNHVGVVLRGTWVW